MVFLKALVKEPFAVYMQNIRIEYLNLEFFSIMICKTARDASQLVSNIRYATVGTVLRVAFTH